MATRPKRQPAATTAAVASAAAPDTASAPKVAADTTRTPETATNDQMVETLKLALQVQREIAAASERQLEMIARQHELARQEMSEFLANIQPLIERLAAPKEKTKKGG